MTIRTDTSPPADRPIHPFLGVFLPTGLTLAATLLGGVWLVRGDRPSHPVTTPTVEQQSAAMPQHVITGTEQGNLVPRPYVVYLVESAETRDARALLGLDEGEVVLVAGTPADLAEAQTYVALLEINASIAPDPREVQVVDLRGPATGLPTGTGERGASSAVAPTGVTVYLVGTAADVEALTKAGDGPAGAVEPGAERVVLSADLDRRAQTQLTIRNLRLEFGDDHVHLVDLRRSSATHATDSAALLGTAE